MFFFLCKQHVEITFFLTFKKITMKIALQYLTFVGQCDSENQFKKNKKNKGLVICFNIYFSF